MLEIGQTCLPRFNNKIIIRKNPVMKSGKW